MQQTDRKQIEQKDNNQDLECRINLSSKCREFSIIATGEGEYQ